ncbi:hypothetical protein KVR01_006081 [Diaporthe batatas]|uniref:uncharacterized protein n=1 Tax=Diaporthe batatas TaxID=748121 RepID=UPI001D051892|nr:uncharacterized protein KVR01_006081 [Diaporthe batatas]KAG8164163.1 hypothetical protein KVR01_006081 [Diaporthe batatas]
MAHRNNFQPAGADEEREPSRVVVEAQRNPPPRLNATPQLDPNRFKFGKKALGDEAFGERLRILSDTHLFPKKFQRPGVNVAPESYDIELAILQRMVIHDLQDQLVNLTNDIHNSRNVSRGMMVVAGRLLREYTEAIRNYDFMREQNSLAKSMDTIDPFLITTKTRPGFMMLREHNMIPVPTDPPAWLRRVEKNIDEDQEWDRNQCILPGGSRSQRQEFIERKGLLERLTMGVAGGTALIIPMLIMVLHKDLLTTLLVTSVSTLIFAGLLAIGGKGLKGDTVLAAIAAYAAVLVVFVGASS